MKMITVGHECKRESEGITGRAEGERKGAIKRGALK
jgi:hypothetical protein